MKNFSEKATKVEIDTQFNTKSRIIAKSEIKQRFEENNRRLKIFMDNYARFFRETQETKNPLSWSTSTVTNDGSDSEESAPEEFLRETTPPKPLDLQVQQCQGTVVEEEEKEPSSSTNNKQNNPRRDRYQSSPSLMRP